MKSKNKEFDSSFFIKNGYKVIWFSVFFIFLLGLYSKYTNSEPQVWCYECNKYVLESSSGHQTEPPKDK